MRINNNISAMNTYSRLNAANNSKAGSLAKLSSGLRINKAGDDAAGLSISEKMRGQIGGLKQSVRNAQDGISLIQTAEGALTETHSILNRMRELAVQASTSTNTEDDKLEIGKEIKELQTELSRISTDTEFNTMKLLDGSRETNELTFHIGANQGQNLKLNIGNMGADALGVNNAEPGAVTDIRPKASDYTLVKASAEDIIAITGDAFKDYTGEALNTMQDKDDAIVAVEVGGKFYAIGDVKLNTAKDGLELDGTPAEWTDTTDGLGVSPKATGINLTTQEDADKSITVIDAAINKVSAERSKLGATQNRLEHTINNLTATSENLSEAESRIRDVDMAEEMMAFTKNNILSQAATSMLAQANQMPQSVLQLLQ